MLKQEAIQAMEAFTSLAKAEFDHFGTMPPIRNTSTPRSLFWTRRQRAAACISPASENRAMSADTARR